MRALIFASLLILALPSQANLLDDIMAWFGGSAEQETEAAAQSTQQKDITSNALKASVAFIPTIIEALGVTEAQAKGGMGAIFLAAKTTLAPEDYAMIKSAIPNADEYISQAPATNELIGSAMSLLGGSKETAAAANLVTQFNDLGLSPDMIGNFGQQAASYVSEQSPEGAAKLKSVISEYL